MPAVAVTAFARLGIRHRRSIYLNLRRRPKTIWRPIDASHRSKLPNVPFAPNLRHERKYLCYRAKIFPLRCAIGMLASWCVGLAASLKRL